MAKVVMRQKVSTFYACPLCHWQPTTPFTVDISWHCPNDGNLLVVQERSQKSEKTCEACHYPVWPGSHFCVHCGEKLEKVDS